MARDDTERWVPGFSPDEILQRLPEVEERAAERWARRQKLVRHDDQGREVHDADALFAAIQWVFAEAFRRLEDEKRPGRAMWDAHVRIEDEDVLNGHLAGLLAFGITRGRADAEAVATAHELLQRTADDLTLAKVRRAIEQVANYELTVTQFDKKMKRVIPVKRPDLPPVAANSVPLSQAVEILDTKLRVANLNLDEHMEQLHLTLQYDSDPSLEQVDAGSLWSGDDLNGWAARVEAAQPFGPLSARKPIQIRIDHERV